MPALLQSLFIFSKLDVSRYVRLAHWRMGKKKFGMIALRNVLQWRTRIDGNAPRLPRASRTKCQVINPTDSAARERDPVFETIEFSH
jgi:hypothetical protein